MPYSLIRHAARKERAYFSCYHETSDSGKPKMVNITPSPPPPGQTRILDLLLDNSDLEPPEAQSVAEFLQPLLLLDPTLRISAADAIQLPWLLNVPSE